MTLGHTATMQPRPGVSNTLETRIQNSGWACEATGDLKVGWKWAKDGLAGKQAPPLER